MRYETILAEKNPKTRKLLINVYNEELKWEAIETKIKRANKTSFLKAMRISHKFTGYNLIDNYNYVQSIIKG